MLNLSKISFDRAGGRVLSNINLEVKPDELLVILGPNGAGKSTLLQTMSGWLQPKKGKVELNSSPLSSYAPEVLAKQMSFLTQFNPLAFDFFVHELITLGSCEYDEVQLQSLLISLGVSNLLTRKCSSLSGGELQRVHWARVLLQLAPGQCVQICLMDEPTSHLDVKSERNCLEYLKSRLFSGFGSVLVLHDLNLAMRYADRILLLNQGKIAFLGPPGDAQLLLALNEAYGVQFDYASNSANGLCQLVF